MNCSKLGTLAIVTITLQLTIIVRAQAEDLSSIAGIWASDKKVCQQAKLDYDERLHIETGGKNGSAESSCQASSITATGSRLMFHNTCSSEGEQFKNTVTVGIAPLDRITWKDGKQPAISYVRCDGANGVSPKAHGSISAPSSFETGSFNLSSHGYSATITSLTGPDTSDASMTGKVTQADAEEECERNSPGGEGLKPKALQKCVAGTLAKETGKEYVARANCQNRTIRSHIDETFRISGVGNTGRARILDSRKQDIGSATALGAPSIQDQFEKLCPTTFKKLKQS